MVDQLDYVLPTGTFNVEKVERNWGTAAQPDWDEMKGWDKYGGALYLAERPATAWTMRIHVQKAFTDPSSDVTLDIPDDKLEVAIWGTCVRAYRQLIGYLVDSKNWDTLAKPDGISMSQVQSWLRDAQAHYEDLLQQYRTISRPRDINLVE